MPDHAFVLSEEQRKGLLVAVISGGRPKLEQRKTTALLHNLDGFGADVIWCVAEHEAEAYESDGREIVTYPTDWAFDYARAHWTDMREPTDEVLMKGGLGSAGRQFAGDEAERRGCWGVLQLDDNILCLSVGRGSKSSLDYARNNGGLALFADLLGAVTLSTNSRMTGAQLQSVAREPAVIARPGIPYSVFIEQVGPGREEWLGPCEHDIIQAFKYSHRADGVTAAIVSPIRYQKCGSVAGGFRSIYDHSRSAGLQRMFPEVAKIGIRRSYSNGRGGARIFHTMQPGAVRNPLRVHDRELMGRAKAKLEGLLRDWHPQQIADNRAKIAARVARAQVAQ